MYSIGIGGLERGDNGYGAKSLDSPLHVFLSKDVAYESTGRVFETSVWTLLGDLAETAGYMGGWADVFVDGTSGEAVLEIRKGTRMLRVRCEDNGSVVAEEYRRKE